MTWTRSLPAGLLGLAALLSACQGRAPESVGDLVTARTVGLVHLDENRLPEAETAFQTVTRLAPEDPAGFGSLGLVYLRMGRYADAEGAFRRALALDSTDLDLRLGLATALLAGGNRDSARAELDRAAARPDATPRLLYARAELLDEPGAAIRVADLARVVTLAPGSVPARLELAIALVGAGLADSALSQLEALRQLPPEPPPEARRPLDEAARLLRAARDGSPAGAPLEGAGAALGRARIALELTIPYQAALAGLRGPQTAVSGVPILTPPPEFAIRRRVGRDTTAPISVTFVDASAAAGLPADWAGITGLDAADYDGDGRDDFAAAGQRFRLLHWAGSGWFDAAAAAGIDEGPAAAAGFADLDGDGRIDLMLVRPDGRAEGYRNGGDGRFTRIAGGAAGLGDVRALRFLDVDHDGDLDVVAVGSAGARLLRNDGTGTLEDLTDAVGLPTTATIDLGGADLDGDGLVDLIVLGADGVPTLLGNTGERRFVPRVAGFARVPGARALALGDYDNDGAIDLLVAGSGGVTAWRNEGDGGFARDPGATRGLAVSGLTDPVLGLTDYDNDGWLDVAVAGRDGAGAGLVRLRRNEGGGRFGDRSTVLPPDLPLFAALVTVDLGGDRDPDLIAAGPAGVRFLRNDGGNLNLAVELRLTGLGTGSGKNNSLGIGSTVEVRAGNLYQKRVVTAASTLIGIGYRLKADVVRVEWPNGVPQTLYTPGNDQDVVEQQVLKSSCAFLYAWDGTATRFVTDAMWRSALGMPVGIGGTGAAQYAPSAASREYVRIPGEALAPIDGSYRIQWTEELWETSYTDRLELVAVDHPDSVLVVVDERFTPPGPAVTLDLHHLADLRPPRLARDDRGVDQLDAVREHDFRYVADLVPTKYQGVTEPHALEIDLGPERGGSTVLVLRGWIFPTDASINVALSQGAGPEVVAPMLEARDPGGRWVPVEALGFPSGKDKTMVVDLTGRLPAGSRRIRIRSTMEVYWDQVAVAARAPAVATVTRLLPAAADLHYRGFSRVYRKGGRTGPHWFDYDAVTTDDPWRPIPGKLTRFGDVRPLLLEDDDRTVVMGPGDEMTVDFPAATAPALPAGWRRDFFLFSVGWIKDGDYNTGAGGAVEPLPFHAMSRYPYREPERYPADAVHRAYRAEYLTRDARAATGSRR